MWGGRGCEGAVSLPLTSPQGSWRMSRRSWHSGPALRPVTAPRRLSVSDRPSLSAAGVDSKWACPPLPPRSELIFAWVECGRGEPSSRHPPSLFSPSYEPVCVVADVEGCEDASVPTASLTGERDVEHDHCEPDRHPLIQLRVASNHNLAKARKSQWQSPYMARVSGGCLGSVTAPPSRCGAGFSFTLSPAPSRPLLTSLPDVLVERPVRAPTPLCSISASGPGRQAGIAKFVSKARLSSRPSSSPATAPAPAALSRTTRSTRPLWMPARRSGPVAVPACTHTGPTLQKLPVETHARGISVGFILQVFRVLIILV